jgi:hypothetical protein
MKRASFSIVLLLLAAANADARTPHINYMLECQGCHLPDGSGSEGAVPSLRGSVARFLTVPGGREFLVRVPGSALAPLDDAQLAAVLNWILAEFGPREIAERVAPFRAEEVGRLRSTPLTDVEGTRRELIRRIEESAR